MYYIPFGTPHPLYLLFPNTVKTNHSRFERSSTSCASPTRRKVSAVCTAATRPLWRALCRTQPFNLQPTSNGASFSALTRTEGTLSGHHPSSLFRSTSVVLSSPNSTRIAYMCCVLLILFCSSYSPRKFIQIIQIEI